MKDTVLEELTAALHRWRNFEECLLHEVRSNHWFYSVDLVFNYVWDSDGAIRKDFTRHPLLVTLRLSGLEEFHLIGALTSGMKQSPERIDWGLSEVALVTADRQDEFLRLCVAWESERLLKAKCLSFQIFEAL